MPSACSERLGLYLMIRALKLQSSHGNSYSMTPSAAEILLYCLDRIRYRAPGILEVGHEITLFFPLFAKRGCWEFSSVHNRPCLLRAFWRLVLEFLFRLTLDRDIAGESVPHAMVFSYHGHDLEVTDQWGAEWYVVVRPMGVGPDVHSRSSTPEHIFIE